jgi:hypothetical protein
VTRGEIYRTCERVPERGGKPGFYVVVSRAFVAENDDVVTVICAPVYSHVLCLTTEVVLGTGDGVPRTSAALSSEKVRELNRALAAALDLPMEATARRS